MDESLHSIYQDDMDDETEWIDDDSISSALRAKIMSLKVCRNRCMAHASSETAHENAIPVLKMFVTLLEHNGALSPDNNDE